MCKGFVAFATFGVIALGTTSILPDRAEARCYTFKASHNGTDMFNPEGGAAGTARNKLLYSIEAWKREKLKKRVRIGKIRTRCGDWYIKYLLPHKTCTARARVCG